MYVVWNMTQVAASCPGDSIHVLGTRKRSHAVDGGRSPVADLRTNARMGRETRVRSRAGRHREEIRSVKMISHVKMVNHPSPKVSGWGGTHTLVPTLTPDGLDGNSA